MSSVVKTKVRKAHVGADVRDTQICNEGRIMSLDVESEKPPSELTGTLLSDFLAVLTDALERIVVAVNVEMLPEAKAAQTSRYLCS